MILLADVGRSKTNWSVLDKDGHTFRASAWEGRRAVLDRTDVWLTETGSGQYDGMVIGLAGLSALSSTERTSFESILRNRLNPKGQLILCSDADLISACMVPDSLAVSLGSGSVLIQSGRDGKKQITGGWGPKFGDELGAGWWWVQLVRHALLVTEDRQPSDAVSGWMEKQVGSGRQVLLTTALQMSDEQSLKLAGQFLNEAPDSMWISKIFPTGWESLMNGIRWDQFQHVYFQGGLTGIPVIHQLILEHFSQSGVKVQPSRIDNLLEGAWFLWQHRTDC